MICRILIFFLFAIKAKGQVLFSDEFNGTEIDASKWDIFLPFSDSQVYVQDGVLKSKNYGFVMSKQTFDPFYSVSIVLGSINSPGVVIKGNDQFVLRQTGLTPTDATQELLSGVSDGMPLFFAFGSTNIGETSGQALGTQAFVFNDYGNRLTTFQGTSVANLDGTSVDYFEEVPIWPDFWLSRNEQPPVFTGSKIGFFGTDSDKEASLFSIQVSVPEPSALSQIAISFIFFAVLIRRSNSNSKCKTSTNRN